MPRKKKLSRPPDFVIVDESHPITDEVRAKLRAIAKPSTKEVLALYRQVGLGRIKL